MSLVLIMAPMRKSDDMNMVAADINEKSIIVGRHSSTIKVIKYT